MYNYAEYKKVVFTDEGQRLLLKIRDRANGLCKSAGCVRCGELIQGFTGSSWDMLACVDRLVEIGDLVEVKRSEECACQDRIFVKPYE